MRRAIKKDRIMGKKIAERGKARQPPRPVKKAAEWIADRLRPEKLSGGNRKLNADILALSGGRKDAVREYHVRKISENLCLCFICFLAAAAVIVWSLSADRSISDGRISRPGYGEAARTEELSMQVTDPDTGVRKRDEGAETRAEEDLMAEHLDGGAATLEIPGKLYTAEEADALLWQALEEAGERMPGENISCDEIRSSLCFPASFAGGSVKAEWTTMPYGIISDDGQIEGEIPEEGVLVSIEAELSCQDRSLSYETAVKVFPPVRNADEEAERLLASSLKEADERSRYEDYLQLPEKVGGIPVRWTYAKDDRLILILLILVSLPVLSGVVKDENIRSKAQGRRMQLERDYPELMWKMALLIGAGMNLSNAFFRIAEDYHRECLTGKEKRYVYEEMLITCHEIRDGISEGRAYESFGRRCGLPRYIRLGSVLSQSLRKGSRGLARTLEKEALSTSQERRAQARKLGEKAGTKLLFPMIMMLCVVFVILAAPAFMTM